MVVRAEEADLSSDGASLLLVEGVDDWHSLSNAYCRITGHPPAFKVGHCGKDGRPGNDSAVLDLLRTVVVGSRCTKSTLGAVIDADADTGVAARLQSIHHALESAYDIPAVFPPQGLIIDPKESRADRHKLPKIGIWLMPDNVNAGIFEDLLRSAIHPESEKYIADVVDQARIDGKAGFRPVERSKAIVKTHIAWQDPKLKNIGVAISASHFDRLDPACRPFMTWLESLFG